MLIKCAECDAEISGWAVTCPECAYPQRESESVEVAFKNPVAEGMLFGLGLLIDLSAVMASGLLAVAIIC